MNDDILIVFVDVPGMHIDDDDKYAAKWKMDSYREPHHNLVHFIGFRGCTATCDDIRGDLRKLFDDGEIEGYDIDAYYAFPDEENCDNDEQYTDEKEGDDE